MIILYKGAASLFQTLNILKILTFVIVAFKVRIFCRMME
jgi:hypothetical protein